MFAFRLKKAGKYSVFDVSKRLRERGWQVPAYTMPADAEEVAVLRVVIREGFTRDLAYMLLEDLKNAVADLEADPPSKPNAPAPQFKH